jgi:2-methylcitrate dehydratase PrpD
MIRREFLKRSTGLSIALGTVTSTGLSAMAAPVEEVPADKFPEVQGLSAYTAGFIMKTRYEDVPENVLALARKSILDGIGLALAGTRNETAVILHRYLESLGCTKADAAVIGTSKRYPARFAAFANGVSIHTEDFDDTQLAVEKDRVYGLLTHPTVSVLPPLLTEAEMHPVNGKEWMTAYLVGVDVECKIAEAISPRSYEDGFHTTGTCGVFGGVAGLAKLRNFDMAKFMNAMGIAAAHSAGLRENFGTMTKPFTAGHSAESAVVATDLAEMGWTAAGSILEAERGFFHAYGGNYNPAVYMNKLGNPWTFADPGVSIKPYPSGSLSHPGMTKMAELIRANHIKAEDVESVDVGVNRLNYNALMRHHPTTGLEAKFSMEYSMAVLLVHGDAGLAEYTDAAVNQPAVQEMLKRVNYHPDAEADAAGFDKMTTIIHIHMKDGRTISGSADFGKGSPANPMSYEEVGEKFRLCAEYVNWPEEKSKQIVELVSTLENVPDMRNLVRLCTA